MDTDTINHEAEDAEARRIRIIEEGMKADGVPTEIPATQDDYFATDVVKIVNLPKLSPNSAQSWVQIQQFNEGNRRKYLNKVNRDVTVKKASGDAILRMAPGEERSALLELAIVGWNLVRDGQPLPFNDRNLKSFLEMAPTKTIDAIEKAVRMDNPFLLGEASADDIRQEIADLEELLTKKLEEEAGNVSS